MLQIEHLSKTYANGVEALKDVSLTIPTGMFGLLGPNGAGKSTLMRTLATLQEPDSGRIELNGTDVRVNPDALRRRLGYLPQEFGVYPRVSPQAMLNHLAILKGIGNRAERAGWSNGCWCRRICGTCGRKISIRSPAGCGNASALRRH